MNFYGRAGELILIGLLALNVIIITASAAAIAYSVIDPTKIDRFLAIIGALGGFPMIIGLYVWLRTLRENDSDSED